MSTERTSPGGPPVSPSLGGRPPRSALEVIDGIAGKVARGEVVAWQPLPLGFAGLDRALGGGLRPGDLMLIGGAQGTGKTTLALQMARNLAASGTTSVLYVCFEHDEEYLLNRLIAMESVLPYLPSTEGGIRLTDVQREIVLPAGPGLPPIDPRANPNLRPALERIAAYGPRLFLMRGSPTATTVAEMHRLVADFRASTGDDRLVVVVDYLQKVPAFPDPGSEAEKVTVVVGALKELALANRVPVVSIVAADKEGLKASRLRNHHLRGSSALNYEADVILILNEKYSIVAKVAIEFNPHQAQRFRDWVIVSLEKNRSGQPAIDLELEKHFAYACFDPAIRPVGEKLVEERLYND